MRWLVGPFELSSVKYYPGCDIPRRSMNPDSLDVTDNMLLTCHNQLLQELAKLSQTNALPQG